MMVQSEPAEPALAGSELRGFEGDAPACAVLAGQYAVADGGDAVDAPAVAVGQCEPRQREIVWKVSRRDAPSASRTR